MADTIYNQWKYRTVHGDVDITTADPRILLLEATAAGAYDPDLDTVTAVLAIATELTATGYARGTVDGEAATLDDGNNRAVMDFTAEVFATLGVAGGGDGSVVACLIYEEGGGADGTRIPISYHDSGFPVVTNGQNLTIDTPSNWAYLT